MDCIWGPESIAGSQIGCLLDHGSSYVNEKEVRLIEERLVFSEECFVLVPERSGTTFKPLKSRGQDYGIPKLSDA